MIRYWIIFCLILSLNLNIRAQGLNQDEKAALQKKVHEMELQLQEECRQLLLESADSLTVTFYADTARIERSMRIRLDYYYSTAGMCRVVNEAEKAYDVLLNKYYRMLSDKLRSQDREKLFTTQRNWLKFRDSENALSDMLTSMPYDEGTIQQILYANDSMERVRKRVEEIYQYLSGIEDPGENQDF